MEVGTFLARAPVVDAAHGDFLVDGRVYTTIRDEPRSIDRGAAHVEPAPRAA